MQEVAKIEKSLKKDFSTATDYTCKSKADFEAGVQLRNVFKEAEKRTKELKDKALKPSLETTKQIREYFRGLESNLMACSTSVKDAMDAWRREEERKAEEKKARVLSDARISKPETLERRLDEISASAATGSTRRFRVVRVTDISLIPLEYFDLNETRLKAALMEGAEIPGAKLINETRVI